MSVPGLRGEDFPAFDRFPGRDSEAVAAELTRRGVIVSPRAGRTRFCMHLCNSSEDIHQALIALDEVLR
jgi:selenocysteine lyase/cysteine desulfurase